VLDDSFSGPMRLKIFDLCITNNRLVIIKPKLIKWAIGFWGRFSYFIQKRQIIEKEKRKQDPLEGLTIDEMLKKDKSSYAINYNDLDWICLNKSLFGSNLTFKGKKIWKLIIINKEQFKQLSRILPKIVALEGKFEINQ